MLTESKIPNMLYCENKTPTNTAKQNSRLFKKLENSGS